jgi:hypothetical protein
MTESDEPDTTPAPKTSGGTRIRSIAAGITGVVAVIGMVAGILGFWTVRTATDSDRFESRVEVLLQREDVSDGLSRRVVGQVGEAIAIRDAIVDTVPEVLQPAVDLLLAGVRARVEDRVAEIIRSPEVSANVAAAAGQAHRVAVDVLEGDDVVDGVAISDGEVRINLLPLTARAIAVTQEFGLLGDVVVPELDRAGDPAEQRAALEAALGRDLADDFGEPVVFRSNSLEDLGSTVSLVQGLFLLAKRVFWLLLILGAGLAALSIWLSAIRWRAACFIVAGLFLFTLIIRLVMDRVRSRLPNAVIQPGAKETVSEIVGGLETSLNHTMILYSTLALVVLGIVAIVQLGVPAWRIRRPAS